MGGTQSVLAQNGEVVNDGVATRQLLHELTRSAEKSTAEVLCLSACEESLGRDLATATGSVDGITDDLHLEANLGVVAGEAVQASQYRGSFIFVVMVEQPSRRLGERDHHNDDNYGEDTLESDGESPSEVVGAVETAVVNPVGNERADGDHGAFDTDDFSAVLGFAAPGGQLVHILPM